jgi:redox-sensitive bicupin YhaK (pirin superfamily)
MNPRQNAEVHYIQMWVPPDTERVTPGYEQLDINGQL